MNVVKYLEDAAARLPGKVSFMDGTTEYTYAQLLETARRIASGLFDAGAGHNQPIAVLIGRNVSSVAAFLGVLMSGNFYVPIDPTLPELRIRAIMSVVRPRLVVDCVGGGVGAAQGDDAGAAQGEACEVLAFEALAAHPIDDEALCRARASALDTDPCYAISTSGSTGLPKAVLVSHRSVNDFIPVFVSTFGFGEDDTLGNQAPFDFDVSVKDIYTTLYCGATCCIIERRCFAMPKLLLQTLNERKVTALVWAVSALCVVASVNGFKHGVPRFLNKVLFSGEVMPTKALDSWREALPNALFVNLYGPTEITCNCMYFVVGHDFAHGRRLPLGRPFPNESVLVLNDQNQPVSEGEVGEICVLGTCVALGYYRNEEQTARSFVQNPLNGDWPQRMYRTGDLAQLGEDGELYFAGRRDFQIKHMGHRIELEEVEMRLCEVDGVERAVCLFDEERGKIVACYVGDAGRRDIARSLRQAVPKYMAPNAYVRLESFPLTKNGKVDRAALRLAYERGA